jgi:hypothetical protein
LPHNDQPSTRMPMLPCVCFAWRGPARSDCLTSCAPAWRRTGRPQRWRWASKRLQRREPVLSACRGGGADAVLAAVHATGVRRVIRAARRSGRRLALRPCHPSAEYARAAPWTADPLAMFPRLTAPCALDARTASTDAPRSTCRAVRAAAHHALGVRHRCWRAVLPHRAGAPSSAGTSARARARRGGVTVKAARAR